MALLAGAVSGYSQGLVDISAYNGGGPGTFDIQVFAVQPSGNNTTMTYGGFTVQEEQGNTAMANTSTASSPSYWSTYGTTVYANQTVLHTGYAVQLLAGPAATPIANLVLQGTPVTTWAPNGDPTQSTAGTWVAGNVAVSGIAGGQGGAPAEVAIAAWYMGASGQYTTLALAQAANAPWGISNEGQTGLLGGSTGGPQATPFLPTTITDFSLGQAAVPEPSTIALGVIGASTFLFRRKK